LAKLRSAASPPLAWGAIGALAGFTGLMVLAQGGAVLNVAFTPLAFAVALLVFRLYPALYIGFVLWIWMLAPFVRRLADWQSGFHAISPVMLAPLVVTGISVWSAWSALPNFRSRRYAPYFAILAIIAWGYYVGVLRSGFLAASYDFLNWACPVFFSLHLLVRREEAQENLNVFFGALAWGALGMGCYGILQYFNPAPWDLYWLQATSAEITSIGSVTAGHLRIFSTLNSPGPFAEFMVGALVALFGTRSKIRWFAAPPGLTAFMLSLVRSAWGGLIIGLVVLVATQPMRRKMRVLAVGSVLFTLAIPVLTVGPISDAINARLDTISSLETDRSFVARQQFYSDFFSTAFTSISGVGLGRVGLASRLTTGNAALGEYGSFDSGIMSIVFILGLAGPVLALLILFTFLRATMQTRGTPQAGICLAIAAATLSQMIFTNTLAGVSGMLVLPLIALAETQTEIGHTKAPAQNATSVRRLRSTIRVRI
jgi:hypothetical protein